ncbi:MAG: hypothetical protein EBV31_08750 [Verrucomicrobia bacterium]|nr:hypothetical protein [Verrucomicrobiota bacterium]
MAVRKRFAENVPGLLLRPMNLDTRRIFVAATRMNDGKTTTCLGLTAALQAMGLPAAIADSTIRVSLGWSTRDSDLDRLVAAWTRLRDRTRSNRGCDAA